MSTPDASWRVLSLLPAMLLSSFARALAGSRNALGQVVDGLRALLAQSGASLLERRAMRSGI
jgi:hypothetical protein